MSPVATASREAFPSIATLAAHTGGTSVLRAHGLVGRALAATARITGVVLCTGRGL
jgi:hypothetical protein